MKRPVAVSPLTAVVSAIVLGFAIGLGAGFAHSLLRRRPARSQTGYLPPVAAEGPEAVPPPTTVADQTTGVGSRTSVVVGE